MALVENLSRSSIPQKYDDTYRKERPPQACGGERGGKPLPEPEEEARR